jgi:hypothetical protein
MTVETMDEINEQREREGKGKAWSRDPYGSWKWPKSAQGVFQAINWFRLKEPSVEPGKKDRAFAELLNRSRRTIQRGLQFLESICVIDRGEPKGRIDGQRVITVIAALATSEPEPSPSGIAPADTSSVNSAKRGPAAFATPTAKGDSSPARAREIIAEVRGCGCDIIDAGPSHPGLLMFHPADMAKHVPQRLKRLILECREDILRLVLSSTRQLE